MGEFSVEKKRTQNAGCSLSFDQHAAFRQGEKRRVQVFKSCDQVRLLDMCIYLN